MDINSHVSKILNTRANNDMKHADAITGDQFEYFMTRVLNHIDFHKVVHTRLVNDHGLDAYGYDDNGQRVGFQYKNYSHSVPYKAVYETLGGATYYKTQKNYLITNNYFTKNTYSTVRAMNQNSSYLIILVNRKTLLAFFKLYEGLKLEHQIERTKQYKKQKKQAKQQRIQEHKEHHWSSVLSDNLNKIKHQSGFIKAKLVNILTYQLSNLRPQVNHVRYLQRMISPYLINNELETNITKSESIHNFDSRIKQFAYYTLRILPKYHVTLNILIKAIKNGTENSHPLGNGYFYNTLTVNIEYPITINQFHNYTKQRLIFVYYPLEYIRNNYPNSYTTRYLKSPDKLNQNDIITIISNVKYINGITTMTGHKKPIDSDANLYNKNQFSVNANTFMVSHTLVNFDDINTLSDSLRLYHNPNSKRAMQSNADYLNKFYSDRKNVLLKTKTKVRVYQEEEKLRKATRRLQINNAVKENSEKYHQLNHVIESDIDKSKAIYNFNSRTKQFAFYTLLLFSKYYVNKYIDAINKATVKKAYNWDVTNSKKFGNQSNKSYYYLVLNIEHNKGFKRILFIYYSPEMMRTEYKNSFPYQSLYQRALNDNVYHENLIGNLTVSVSINAYTFISNLLFNPYYHGKVINSFNYNGINRYQFNYGNMPVVINDIKSLVQGHNRQKQSFSNKLNDKSFKVCPVCHTKVSKSARFCTYCGYRFH